MATSELSVVLRQGNFSFPSEHEAKAYCFDLFFCSKAKSIRFSDIINILTPFSFALKSALRLGFVVLSAFWTVGLLVKQVRTEFSRYQI
ncbi:hypothetical protein DZC72_11325 [Maribacter algicola]|uniref:Uncharacterized protein n=1 Tax=Maribacter algicola TaxID=2498892 RepID=A0A426RH50_9FLAO|nr:hypothetical protein DZC72_11325 [Maribacter algicola]